MGTLVRMGGWMMLVILYSNRFDIVDVEERETVLEIEEVDKKHLSASAVL